jgi:lipoate-protein ligase A
MILWVDGAHDATENMQRDARLLDAAGRGALAEPILRLFRFGPHGITLGHGQEPERELDLDACRARSLGWARRPTGGRAILHAQEWTYALVAPIGHPDWGGTLGEAYDRASALVAASLRALGVPCSIAGRGARPERSGRATTGRLAAPCFASTSRHEIVIEGRKCVGSAQRRTANALLQQGSVLLGDGHLAIADVLAVADDQRDRVRRDLAAVSTHAGTWIAPDTPLATWADAIEGVRSVTRIEGTEDVTSRFAGEPGAGGDAATVPRVIDGPRSGLEAGRPAGSG